MFGSLKVVAMNLSKVAKFEARHGVVQELQDIDGGLIGQRRQCDANGSGAVCHGVLAINQRLGETRRAVVAAGWAKISR